MVVIADRQRRGKFLVADEAHAQASAMVEEQYQNFDVVWAKLGSFPWWPGVLFFTWDAVNESGLDLKQTQQQLPIPPPTMQTLPDGKQRLVYSVLIMFLDRFNCSVIEVTPKTVCPFAINYERLKNKHKGKGGFKIALGRAMRLLHMHDHMTVDELDAIAPIRVQPTEEERAEIQQQQLAMRTNSGKRQKRAHASRAAAKDDVQIEEFEKEGEEEEEEEASLESDYTDGEREAPTKRPAKSPKKGKKVKDATTVSTATTTKKGSSKAPQRILDLSGGGKKTKQARGKQTGKHKPGHRLEAIDDEADGDSDFEIVGSSHKATAKPTLSRKKASRKEGRTHHDVIDIDADDDDESSGDFQMSIARPPSKSVRQGSTKTKSAKLTKVKSDQESATEPTKQKKTPRDADFDVVPTSKPHKKRAPKHHHHHHQDDSHGLSEKTPSFDARPSREPLTLTPLSTIWTSREASNTAEEDKKNAENFTRLAYKLDHLWDEAIFTDETPRSGSNVEVQDSAETTIVAATGYSERGVGKRQVRSVQQSQIRQSMLTGNLDPHTMVQCEAYLPMGGAAHVEAGNSRSRGAGPQIEAPFDVVVHPDVVFVCDLHSHLATCEIIGFLGGRWDDATKTLYIQAAFPCRSLEIEGDDGSTDVEMDPGSEIELREIIQNAELEVVGWYHSHPAFAPDPSIRDIENQTSYQQLFQRSKLLEGGKTEISYPFVGLIVGTYDQRRESPVGLFRYFHTREERLNSGMRGAVYMPYELVPRKRHYRSVLEDEKRDRLLRLPLYVSVAEALFGADKACFVKSPTFPNDEKDMRVRDRKGAPVSLENGNAAAGGRKKRKGSTDLAQAAKDESVQQPAKKKRGRPKNAKIDYATVNPEDHEERKGLEVDKAEAAPKVINVVECEAPPEVIDLITDTSQELSQSQEQGIFPTNVTPTKESPMTHPDMFHRPTQDAVDSVPSTDISMENPVVTFDPSEDPAGSMSSKDLSMENPDAITPPNEEVDRVTSKDASTTDPDATSHIEDTNYDASQSQNTSDSQPCSQPEEVVASEPRSNSPEVEEDYFAGVEIIKSSESYFVAPSEESSGHIDPTPVPPVQLPQIDVKGSDVVVASNTSNNSSTAEEESTGESSNSHVRDQQIDNPRSQSIVTQDIVGDSGSDITGAQTEGDGEVKAQAVDCVVEQTPTEDDSGLNSGVSGGGSTPINASMPSTGRRRTRKPSLTTRRLSGTAASPGPKSVSPVGNATFEVDEGGGAKGDDAKIKPDRAIATVAANNTVSTIDEQKTSVDSSWDGVEIISQDYMDDSPSTEPEPTAPNADEDEPVIEPTSEGVKSEADPIIPPVVVNQQPEAVVDSKVSVKLPEEVVGTWEDEKPDHSSTPDSIQVPEHKPDSLQVPEHIPKLVHFASITGGDPVKADLHEVYQTALSTSRQSATGGGRKPKSKEPVDFTGIISEPLEQYGVKDLRVIVSRMQVSNLVPVEGRGKKHGYIAAIRTHWSQCKPSSNDQGTVPVGGAMETVTRSPSEMADPINAVMILGEAKEVVCSLVTTVDTLVVGGAAPDIAPSKAGMTKSEGNTKTPTDQTVESASEAPETVSTVSPNVKPDTADPTANPPDLAGLPAATTPKPSRLEDRHAVHLQALRTKYGAGAHGCTEQVITLIDYYCDFHRRTELYDSWKGKVSKGDKIEASLRADVEYVNLPVALRDAFIKDMMGYLRTSWKLSGRAMR